MATANWDETGWRSGHTAWKWVAGYGAALALAGILPLSQPVLAGLALAWVLGFALIVAGALALWAGVSRRGWRSEWLDIGTGLLSLVIGLGLLASPLFAAISLAWMLGFWLVACGVAELATIATTRLHRGWLAVLGIIDVVLGIFLFAADPVTALAFLGFAIGLSLTLRGISLVFLGFRLRRY